MKFQINWRDPKYALPAIAFLPVCGLIYLGMDIFGGSDEEIPVAAADDDQMMALPDANTRGVDTRYQEMSRQWGREADAFGAFVDGSENDGAEAAVNIDSLDELALSQELEDFQRELERSRMSVSDVDETEAPDDRADLRELARQLDDARREAEAQASPEPVPAQPTQMPPVQLTTEEEPKLVEKAQAPNKDLFYTLISEHEAAEETLIKATIDETIKAQDGTRLRFKLMDDITVDNVPIKKGTYLYGIVSGFETQRVKANISSIFVNGRFIKVSLSVYDNDGMEGFYVPASAFREFAKDASSTAVGQNINVNSSYSNMAESMALQAMQDVYSSASNALQKQIRKNKAKIKYNTIVYLINTKNQ